MRAINIILELIFIRDRGLNCLNRDIDLAATQKPYYRSLGHSLITFVNGESDRFARKQ